MKKAIVIGATSGIGKGLAIELATHGYYVGIAGRRDNLLLEMKNKYPDKFLTRVVDVTNTDLALKRLDEMVKDMGGLDLLIISSGTGDSNHELKFYNCSKTLATNVEGFTAIAIWAYNYFEKQKTGQLVAITSVAGLRGNRHGLTYSASKAYQIAYLEGLRQKAKNSKLEIYTTDIRPGFVDTDLANKELLFWSSSVERAAKDIFYAIDKKKNIAYITKRWFFVAMLLKLVPERLYNRL